MKQAVGLFFNKSKIIVFVPTFIKRSTKTRQLIFS